MQKEPEQAADITIYPLGIDGYVLRISEVLTDEANAETLALADHLQTLPDVVEVAPSLTSVFLRFDPKQTDRASFIASVKESLIARRVTALAPTRRWTIPVCFDEKAAPQLPEVSDLTGLTQEALVSDLCAARLRVFALGFAPGQPYIGLLPDAWDIPRQTTLTEAVPAGAITVAVRQIVLFANRSATGWRQIGQCAFRPFDLARDPVVALRAGDEIRFEVTGRLGFDPLFDTSLGGARLETL